MANIKIREESYLGWCDICHQSDCFDPITNYCSRCLSKSNLPQNKIAEDPKSFKNYSSELSAQTKTYSYAEQKHNNDPQKLAIECFYHPNTSIIGMCKVCQKAICRNCVNWKPSKILLCKDCDDPEQREGETTVLLLIVYLGIFLLVFLFSLFRR